MNTISAIGAISHFLLIYPEFSAPKIKFLLIFGQRPEGVHELCFHTYGEFSAPSPPPSSPHPPLSAGYPIILTILDLWVRRVTIVGFLDSFTMGKWVFP